MSTPNSAALIYPKADLSLATVLPHTQNSDGSWTPVASAPFSSVGASLLGYLDSIVLNIDQQLIEAISVDASYMNRIPTIIDSMAVVTENVRRPQSVTDGPYLPLVTQSGMAKVSFVYNGVTTHSDLYTLYGAWERCTGGIQGVGGQKAGMVVRQVDTSYTTVGGVSGVPPISIVRA